MKKKWMKNTAKMILAGVLAMNMVTGMPVMAESSETETGVTEGQTTPAQQMPSEKDRINVSVSNVEPGALVTAYRIVRPVYRSDGGFVGFERVNNITTEDLADIESPTKQEIAEIAQKIKADDSNWIKAVFTESDGTSSGSDKKTYTGNIGAGEYIVLVSSSSDKLLRYVYNPAVVSADYTNANDKTSLIERNADVDKDSKIGQEAYIKRSLPGIKLNVAKRESTDPDSKAGSFTVRDQVPFKVTATIPEYSDAFSSLNNATDSKTLSYRMTLIQPEGLEVPKVSNIDVSLITDEGQNPEVTTNTAYTVKFENLDNGNSSNDLQISFKPDFILSHAGQQIVVTYRSKLNADAKTKFIPNTVKGNLTYTTDLNGNLNQAETVTKTEETAEGEGQNVASAKIWNGIRRVSQNKESEAGTQKANEPDAVSSDNATEDEVNVYTLPIQIKKVDETDEENGLTDAEFTITKRNTTLSGITDQNGLATYSMLGENSLVVKETKAPEHYSLNPNTYQLTIVPQYADDGKTLKSYTATLTDKNSQEEVGSIEVTDNNDSILVGTIKDTHLQTLPGAGGQGIRNALIIALCLAGATTLIVLVARKKEKK